MGGTVFYRDRDGTLGRERERRCPEVLHEDGVWRFYPALDPLHEARVISRAEAIEMLPEGTDPQVLDSLPERGRVVIDRLSDVAEWGDKETGDHLYSEPFEVAGEVVDIDSLPAFGDETGP